jgi:hypothetical protein
VPSKRSASISAGPGPGKEKKAKIAPGNAWIAGQVAAMQVQYKVRSDGEAAPVPWG